MTETQSRPRKLAPAVTVAALMSPYDLTLPRAQHFIDRKVAHKVDPIWPLVSAIMAKMICFKSMLLLLNKGKIVGFGNRMTRAPQASLKKGLTEGWRGNGKSQLMS